MSSESFKQSAMSFNLNSFNFLASPGVGLEALRTWSTLLHDIDNQDKNHETHQNWRWSWRSWQRQHLLLSGLFSLVFIEQPTFFLSYFVSSYAHRHHMISVHSLHSFLFLFSALFANNTLSFVRYNLHAVPPPWPLWTTARRVLDPLPRSLPLACPRVIALETTRPLSATNANHSLTTKLHDDEELEQSSTCTCFSKKFSLLATSVQ